MNKVMFSYRLRFSAPFHVDSRGNDNYEQTETFIRSDTLSAAILSAWSLLAPEGTALRAAKPPFLLSSAFPWVGKQRFLPRPVSTLAVHLDSARLRDNKKLKKIQWLSTGLWQAVANGMKLDNTESLNIKGNLAMLRDETLEVQTPWIIEERPRLAMDRLTNAHADELLFHFSRVWFHPEAGLHFFAAFSEADTQRDFEAALALLGDEGIGADRSNGNGVFSFEHNTETVFRPATRGAAMALSLVSPDPSDRVTGWLDDAAYKLVSRGGWIGRTGLRKQRVRLFAEGSVFNRPLTGQVLDVTPENNAPHPVFRDGRGLFIALEA